MEILFIVRVLIGNDRLLQRIRSTLQAIPTVTIQSQDELPPAQGGRLVLISDAEGFKNVSIEKDHQFIPKLFVVESSPKGADLSHAYGNGFQEILAPREITPAILQQRMVSACARYDSEMRSVQRAEMLATLCDSLPREMVYRIVKTPGRPAQFMYVSAGSRFIAGMSPEQVLANPTILYEHIHPDDREHYAQVERRAVAAVTAFDCDVRKRIGDGRERWSHIRSIPHAQLDGTVIWDGIESDITAYKEVETALRKSEERYRAFLSHSTEGIWRIELSLPLDINLPLREQLDHILRYSYLAECNEATARMYGFERAADLTGIELSKLMPAYIPENLTFLRSFIESGYRLVDAKSFELMRSGAKAIFLNNLVGIVENGFLTRLWGTRRDVTANHQAEAALRLSEAQFRHLANSMPQIVWTADDRGRITYVNDRWYQFTGAEAAVEGTADIKAILHPDDRSAWQQAWSLALQGSAFEVECRLHHAPSNSYRWVLARASRITDGTHAPSKRWYGTCTDIHDQKVLLAEREQLLESEREARMESERTSRLKDEFLATLSHELRTPINAVLGWSQLAKRGGLQSEDAKKALEIIERNARAQAQLIEDLLDMNRIVSGKLRLEMSLLNLQEVAAGTVSSIAPTASAKGVNVRLSAPGSTEFPIFGDPSRIQQILWNLMTNAVKFTPKGGTVTISIRPEGDHFAVSVADEGIGISKEFVSHVFDRFRQADSTTTRRYGGLGIGLSIVKHLTELHGGAVHAESPGEGKGATFTVLFPSAGGRGMEMTHFSSVMPDSPDLSGHTALVVDDEPDALELVRRILTESGMQVQSAPSVKCALDILADSTIDIMISDIGMPEQDGFNLIKEVRSRDWRSKGIPAVALTAFARAEDRARTLVAGYQMHVPKPVDARQLLMALRSLLPPMRGESSHG